MRRPDGRPRRLAMPHARRRQRACAVLLKQSVTSQRPHEYGGDCALACSCSHSSDPRDAVGRVSEVFSGDVEEKADVTVCEAVANHPTVAAVRDHACGAEQP